MSHNEVEVLWEAMDVNSSENVSMAEFGAKLERFGLKLHTREEHIIY